MTFISSGEAKYFFASQDEINVKFIPIPLLLVDLITYATKNRYLMVSMRENLSATFAGRKDSIKSI